MNQDGLDYKRLLRAELKRRQIANPRFSLRAFARHLAVSPGFLSAIMSGLRCPSKKTARLLAEKLGYSPHQADEFSRLVGGEKSAPLPEFETLGLDAFQVLSDWYHYAILELSRCKPGVRSLLDIQKRLGLSRSEARQALERLERFGLIEKTAEGWLKTKSFIATPTDQPNRALRLFQSQMLEKAKTALDEQSVFERDITSITIPMDPNKLELAKAEIRDFRRRMASLLSEGTSTEVYHLGIQLFRVTQPTSPSTGVPS